MKPWIAWPILALVLAFAWNFYNLPSRGTTSDRFTISSVNPVTNTIVLSTGAADKWTSAGFQLGASLLEKRLQSAARSNFNLWGMLIGYSVVVETN